MFTQRLSHSRPLSPASSLVQLLQCKQSISDKRDKMSDTELSLGSPLPHDDDLPTQPLTQNNISSQDYDPDDAPTQALDSNNDDMEQYDPDEAPIITLAESVSSWNVGDQIVIGRILKVDRVQAIFRSLPEVNSFESVNRLRSPTI